MKINKLNEIFIEHAINTKKEKRDANSVNDP